VAAHEARCPFCRAPVGLVGAASAAMALAVSTMLIGCGDDTQVGGDATEGAGASSTGDGASLSSTSASTVTDASSSSFGTNADTSTTEIDTGMTSNGFIYGAPDGGDGVLECDVWAQDCPADEKCVPWANDGGNGWNAARCSPIAATPREVSESCVVEGGPTSGIDDCALGAVCWRVDETTLEGTCVAQCGGSPDSPECPGDLACGVIVESVAALCLTTCDPFAPTCPDGDTCGPVAAGFFCLPNAT
jgi:hypothetical protein